MEQLSRAIPEQADFSTDVCDNGRIAVAVLPLTPSAGPLVSSILRYLRKLPPFQAAEQREGVLSLRFLSSLPHWVFPDSVKKDGFSTSRRRRLACLLCVDYCTSESAVSKATEGFKEASKQLGNTLLASRCLIYGPMEPRVDEKRGVSFFNLTSTPDAIAEGEGDIQYKRLEGILSECMATVYSKLNGVARENDPLKLSGSSSLTHDNKDGVGGASSTAGQQGEDGEQTRLIKAQTRKLLADVHLLCGHCHSALKTYQSALHELRHFKDHLWVGGALEGVVSASLLLRGMDTAISLALPARTHAETTRHDGTGTRPNSRPNSDIENHESSIGSRTHSNSSSLGMKKSGDPMRDSVSSSGGSETDGMDGTTPTSSMAGDEDLVDYSNLTSDVTIEKNFKLAIDNYSKVGSAGRRPHTETLIMFAGYLARRNKHRRACQLLEEAQCEANQDSVLSTPQLKLSLYLVMSEVYDHMAMQRKSVFMLYYAGKQASDIATSLGGDRTMKDSNTMLKKAYQLLWRCLFQYHQSPPELDKPVLPDHTHQQQGWPQLQAQFITQFVDLCKKLDQNELVIKWGWMLLQRFHSLLTHKELNQITDCITGATISLKTLSSEDQEISAPSQATNLPVIAVFKPQPLAPQLAVKQSRNLFSSALSSQKGPFIYSALFKRKPQDSSSEVLWVQGDPAEVLLMISNPLPFEIRIEKMTMTLQGGPVTTYPSNITLPSCCEPQQFVLLCIPQKPGTLSLTGYKADLFGLKIECTVKSIADLVIKVLPTLPQLRAKIVSLSDGRGNGRSSPILTKRSSVTMLDSWELLDGEEVECYFQMQSIGDVPVDNVKMSQTEKDEYCKFVWSDDDIAKLLPLSTKNKVYNFSLKAYASIPSYLRVGSCEILPTSYSSPSLNHTPGIVTIYESPRNSPMFDKSGSLSNANRFKHPAVKKSVSLHRSMHDPSQFSTSPLMESLDLPHPIASEQPSSQAKKLPAVQNHSPVENQASYSPRSSQRQWKPWRGKMTVVAHSSTPPSSPQTSIKNGGRSGRLMDSLNLDQPQNMPKQPSDSARNSIVSPDTTSELDFETTTFGDAVSLKSEPGDLHPSPSHSAHISSPSHSTSSSSNVTKSATIAGFRDSAALKDLTDRFTDKFSRVSRKANTVQTGQRTRRTDSGKATLAISSPKGPLHKAVRRPPKSKTAKGSFLLQYTGGEGSKEGYYRSVTVDVSLTIKPTLIFYNFSVATIKGSPDQFQFKLVIENLSQHRLSVSCNIQQAGLETPQHQWVMEGGNKTTAQLVLKRFNIAEGTDPHSTQINEVKLYCERLIEMIQFKWTSDRLNKNGNLSLQGLQLPQSALNIIRPLPVLFRPLLKPDRREVGVPIEFQLGLINNSGDVLPPSLVTLHPYQHVSQSARVTCSEGDQIVFSHSLSHSIPQLQPDQTHQLSLTLIFLYKGNYSIEVAHHLPQSPPLPAPPPEEEASTSPLNQRATLQQLAKSNSPLLSQLNSLKPLCSPLAPLSRTNSPSFRAKTPVTVAAPIPVCSPSTLHQDLVTDSNSYTGSKLWLQISEGGRG